MVGLVRGRVARPPGGCSGTGRVRALCGSDLRTGRGGDEHGRDVCGRRLVSGAAARLGVNVGK